MLSGFLNPDSNAVKEFSTESLSLEQHDSAMHNVVATINDKNVCFFIVDIIDN
jgi:hypothetical protein